MKATRVLLYVLLVLFSLIMLFPFISTLINSFKSDKEIILDPWKLPQSFTAGIISWSGAWSKLQTGMKNSIILGLCGSVLSVFLGALCAFALTRLKFRLQGTLYYLVVAGMFVPYEMGIIPMVVLTSYLRIYNTLLGLIIVQVAWGIPFNTFTLGNFFATFPSELQDSANLDGSSNFTFFWKILLPLSLPILATQLILEFRTIYNTFIWAIVLTRGPEAQVVQVALVNIVGELFVSDWGMLAAASILASVPVLIGFFMLQRYIEKGLMLGALKR